MRVMSVLMSNESNIQVGSDGSIQISGEMTFSSTPRMYRELESRFSSEGSELSIDLGRVEHADSSGLALLLEWQAMANRLNRTLLITNAPRNLLSLARLCEADTLLKISGRESGNDADG